MSAQDPPREPSPKAKRLAARLASVQALYEVLHAQKPLRPVVQDILGGRADMEADGEELVPPDGAFLKKILFGVEERQPEIEAILKAHLSKSGPEKEVEPLLRAILLCGIYELLAHQDIDFPIIINDYVNVAHGFYGGNEPGLVNGILDACAKALRAQN